MAIPYGRHKDIREKAEVRREKKDISDPASLFNFAVASGFDIESGPCRFASPDYAKRDAGVCATLRGPALRYERIRKLVEQI